MVRSKVEDLVFDPPPECDTVTNCTGRAGLDCDLSCVWPGAREPLVWEGD